MDRKEFLELATIIKSCYPKDNLFGIEKVVEIWYKQLEDLDYGVAMTALNKWIATEKWPPSIADIRSLCVDIKEGVDPDAWSKAWEQVNKMIQKYGYYRPDEAYRELDAVDPLATEAIKRLGYCHVCMSENQVAERANFRDIYLQLAKRKKEDSQIPEQLRMTIDGMRNLCIAGNDLKQLEESL